MIQANEMQKRLKVKGRMRVESNECAPAIAANSGDAHSCSRQHRGSWALYARMPQHRQPYCIAAAVSLGRASRWLVQAERRAAERANEEEFRRRMLERFAEEDRLEQMNMQVGAARPLRDGWAAVEGGPGKRHGSADAQQA